MKKILLFTVLALCCSCSRQEIQKTLENEYKHYNDCEVIYDYGYVENMGEVSKVKFEDHQYLIVQNSYKAGIVHDGNCPCREHLEYPY